MQKNPIRIWLALKVLEITNYMYLKTLLVPEKIFLELKVHKH